MALGLAAASPFGSGADQIALVTGGQRRGTCGGFARRITGMAGGKPLLNDNALAGVNRGELFLKRVERAAGIASEPSLMQSG